MISYVTGELVARGENKIVVDHQGIGLEILIPGSFMDRMPGPGTTVKIHTYFHVKEDAMQLFGFETAEDKELFKLLITVSGIGPKGGLGLMGTLTSEDIRFAILSEDAGAIAKAPGIGAKTAKKLILELKDKISMQDTIETALVNGQEKAAEQTGVSAQNQADAVEALTALGYSATDALKAVRGVENGAEMTVEQLLRASLKNI